MAYPGGGTGYPAGNFFPTTTAALGFVNEAAGDFRLAANSAYKGKAAGGTDPGADIVLLNAAIASVIVGP